MILASFLHRLCEGEPADGYRSANWKGESGTRPAPTDGGAVALLAPAPGGRAPLSTVRTAHPLSSPE